MEGVADLSPGGQRDHTMEPGSAVVSVGFADRPLRVAGSISSTVLRRRVATLGHTVRPT